MRDLTNDFRVDLGRTHGFHHGKMLEIVVRLKKRVSGKELHQNTSNAPDITSVAPAEVQNNFRSTIVAGRNYGGVVFVVKGCRSKVD